VPFSIVKKIIAKVITSVGGFIEKMADYEQGLKGIVIHNQSLEFELVMHRPKTLLVLYLFSQDLLSTKTFVHWIFA
jgi:hypothetical protein